jgi:superfamily II DNA or RNA helicase
MMSSTMTAQPSDLAQNRSLRDVDFITEYRTGQVDLIEEFYRPCLARATHYDRAVGFFRSSIFLMIGIDILDFAKRGGQMRLICSSKVTREDLNAFEEGYERRQALQSAIDEEVDQLMTESPGDVRLKILSTLIAQGVIEVKIAVLPRDHLGQFHDKIGLFFDRDENIVSFKGSSNETRSGWHPSGNHESFDVFCSWLDDRESTRVCTHKNSFERLWNGKTKDVSVYEVPEASRQKLFSIASTNIGFLEDEIRIESEKEAEFDIPKPEKLKRILRPHQAKALEDWRAANFRGLFEHATGSGKTFTALNAIGEHIAQGLPVIILVPSRLLLDQWKSEIEKEFPGVNLLLVGGGNTDWRKGTRLRSFSSSDPELGERIILGTMQTCCKPEFVNQISGVEHLLIVVDEVHQIGSAENSNALNINAGKRLGLSATPERYGDPEGTQRIMDYFGGIIEPPFTLADAIEAGCLVRYQYFPDTVYLTATESDEWAELSRQLRLEVARNTPAGSARGVFSDRAKMLTIQRSRIAKKADGKLSLAVQVLRENYQKGERWLVYCEDQEQLRDVLGLIRTLGYDVNEYHTQMGGAQKETLNWFIRNGGILVAIGCLDEGVDIPEISHALILASSQNPRQFIQRRGRVLRKADEKYMAYLYDVLVVPPHIDDEPDQKPLLQAELTRAIEFAEMAFNEGAAAKLRQIAIASGMDLETLREFGDEA